MITVPGICLTGKKCVVSNFASHLLNTLYNAFLGVLMVANLASQVLKAIASVLLM